MGDAAKLIEKLAAHNPNAVQLAKLVSLAIRIEPELLRQARLELLPDTDAGSEADLWFSDLVESHNPAAIVFRRDVTDFLRKKLAENRQMLDAAWRLIETVHQHASPAIRAEEEMTWLALSGQEQPMKELLRSVLATMIQPQRAGLLEWAARAFPRLPKSVRESEEGQMLAFGLSLRLEEPEGYDIANTAGSLPDWAAWLTPADLPTASFGVRLVQGAVEFGPPGKVEDHPLELPETTPILIELNWHQGLKSRTQRIHLNPEEVTTVDIAPRIYVSQHPAAGSAHGDQFIYGLRQFFGDESIIATPDNPESGRDIAITIETVMKSCHVMIVLIDPRRFKLADPESRKQTVDPMEILQMEYQAGQDMGLKIVPVLLDNARLPQGEGLPENLASLPSLEAYAHGPDSGQDLDELIAVFQGDIELQTVLGQRYRLYPSFEFDQKKKFISRNRWPRVQIEYEVEQYGTLKIIELPFVMGVLADFSGRPGPDDAIIPVDERKFLKIDADNFNERFRALKPHAAFDVPNMHEGEGNLKIDLAFDSLDDFSPAAVARKVESTRELLEARTQLNNLLIHMDGKIGAEELIIKLINDPSLLKALTLNGKLREQAAGDSSAEKAPDRVDSAVSEDEKMEQTQAKAEIRPSDSDDMLAQLQKEIKPRTELMRQQVENAVHILAEYVLKDVNLQSNDAVKTIETVIAAIDQELTEQVNQILHHEEFQKLESAWRGLHYLVNNTETDELLKIRLINISKAELAKTLKEYKGSQWDTSPIFQKIYEEEFGRFGGEPYGCLVGDFYFDHSLPDVELLSEIAKIAAAAHAPFITGASPSVMQMDSWQELSDPGDLAEKFSQPDYSTWRSLRDSEDARYIGLAMPRFLARLPYGAKTDPVEEFDFEEEVEGADSNKYTWANSAYAMAANINRAFKLYGWCARIRGVETGGAVEGLPVHTFPTDDGGVDMKSPTEIGIGARREAELAQLGFMPLIHHKNSDFAAFIGTQSLQKLAEYEDPDATANANLAARLPYLFACCRFAHYLKCIVRDKIGSFKERDDMQRWLQMWVMQYVDGDPTNSGEATKARKPLAAAEVVVEEVEGNPGYYMSILYLQPHYQLEGLTVSLRLVSKLPSVR
jgi:type VI secretion system protein ImpC